jgi:hypothetical protein
LRKNTKVTVIARKQDNAYRFEKISCFRGNPIIPEHHHPVTVPKVTILAEKHQSDRHCEKTG